MVDAVNLPFVESFMEFPVELLSGSKVVSERFFKDYMPPRHAGGSFLCQSRSAEMVHDIGIERGRHCEVEDTSERAGFSPGFAFRLIEFCADRLIKRGVVIIPVNIVDPAEKFADIIGTSLDPFCEKCVKGRVVQFGTGASDDPGLLVEQPALEELEERGDQLSAGKISRCSEDCDCVWYGGDFQTEAAAPCVFAVSHNFPPDSVFKE